MAVRVSVAMAVYNGEKYIEEQLRTALNQLSEQDEVVISYNKSNDRTYEIISDFAKEDKRIHIFFCEERGVQANFNNAITKSKGEYIFLCDQDDVWLEGKVEKVVAAFKETDAQMVMHDGYISDSELVYKEDTVFGDRKVKRGILKNLVKVSYHGCCMAICQDLKEVILPLPRGPFYHDFWIGMICEFLHKKVVFLDEKLMIYRRHGDNLSGPGGRTFFDKVSERLLLLWALVIRLSTCHYYSAKVRNKI